MPSIDIDNALSLDAANAIVDGFCAFEGIDRRYYPRLDEKKGEISPRFQWKICLLEKADHYTAFLIQHPDTKDEKKAAVGIYNDSANHPENFERPIETLGFDGVEPRNYFKQTPGSNDCGFCSAFVVIEAMKHVEQQLKDHKDDHRPSLATFVPTTNPFQEETRIIARMQSAFYLNCRYLKLDLEIKALEKEEDYSLDAIAKIKAMKKQRTDYASTLSPKNDYKTLHELFEQTRIQLFEQTGALLSLTDNEFKAFVGKHVSSRRFSFLSILLYQNIILYLLLNHFQNICNVIKNNPDALSCDNVLKQASNVDEKRSFYQKTQYESLATRLLSAPQDKHELKEQKQPLSAAAAPASSVSIFNPLTAVARVAPAGADAKMPEVKRAISKAAFQDAIKDYETTSKWRKLLSCFSNNILYGSTAIRELRKLSSQEEVSLKDIEKACGKRYRFFTSENKNITTSTDDVIEKLRQKFTK